jgi:phosphonate metabolism-associated iron-containing alcohol dehydrogenase
MMWTYHHPVRIRWCEDLSQGLAGLLPEGHGLVLVYAEDFLKSPEAQPLSPLLNHAAVYCGADANPSLDDVQRAIDFSKGFRTAWILAVGGGSVIDTAKAVRLAQSSGCTDADQLISRAAVLPVNRSVVLAAVPTTHGSGSEMTPWATVWDKQAARKLSLANPDNFPDSALYCPSLTCSLPLAGSCAATLDALSHSLEALWNRRANPIADELSLSAIQLIYRHLPRLNNETDLDCRRSLLRAAMFAGMAFSSTKTAAAHSISYPLTLRFRIPHGIACSLPLAALWRINAPLMGEKASRLLGLLGTPTAVDFFRGISDALMGKIPYTLAEYGVQSSDLEQLAHESFTAGRMENTLAHLNETSVREILRSVLDERPV